MAMNKCGQCLALRERAGVRGNRLDEHTPRILAKSLRSLLLLFPIDFRRGVAVRFRYVAGFGGLFGERVIAGAEFL
jgi:hypothetical protein